MTKEPRGFVREGDEHRVYVFPAGGKLFYRTFKSRHHAITQAKLWSEFDEEAARGENDKCLCVVVRMVRGIVEEIGEYPTPSTGPDHSWDADER